MASSSEPPRHPRLPPVIMERVGALAGMDTRVGRLINRMITQPEFSHARIQPERVAPFGKPYLVDNSAGLNAWQYAFFVNLCNVVAWEDSSKKSILLASSLNDHSAAQLATSNAKQCHKLVDFLLNAAEDALEMTNEVERIMSFTAICRTCTLADHGPGRPAVPYQPTDQQCLLQPPSQASGSQTRPPAAPRSASQS